MFPAAVNQCILITGATGAIGGALAIDYAAPGRTLVLQGRNEARILEIAKACEARGATVETRLLELRDTAALVGWVDELARHRPVDLALVNAATINVLRPGATGESWSDVDRVMDVNVRAALAIVATLLPHMKSRRSGQIALIGSLSAWFGMPVAPAYSASKAALKSYGDALRCALAADGIKINVVLPGFVKSDMSDELRVPKLFMLTPGDAARRIRRGLEENRAHVSFPLSLAVSSRLISVLPPSIQQRVITLLGYGHP